VTDLFGAKKILEQVRDLSVTKSVCIGLSGGKDSLAVLDLAVRSKMFKKVDAYFAYLVKGIRVDEAQREAAIKRYPGVTLHNVPHWSLAEYIRAGVCRPHVNRKVPQHKMVDIENYFRETIDCDWFLYGHRMTDSLQRRGMLHSLAGCDKKARRAYPLWQWRPKHIYAYLRVRRIPVPPRLSLASTSGVNLRPATLRVLRDKYPEDFARVLKVFPYAETQLVRDDLKAAEEERAKAHEASALRD